MKYLVWWKWFTAEYNMLEREKDLENAKKAVAEFERRLSAEVRRQEKLDLVKEWNFRRGKLLEKYIAKILYEWDDRSFEKVGKKLVKIEVSFFKEEILKRR